LWERLGEAENRGELKKTEPGCTLGETKRIRRGLLETRAGGEERRALSSHQSLDSGGGKAESPARKMGLGRSAVVKRGASAGTVHGLTKKEIQKEGAEKRDGKGSLAGKASKDKKGQVVGQCDKNEKPKKQGQHRGGMWETPGLAGCAGVVWGGEKPRLRCSGESWLLGPEDNDGALGTPGAQRVHFVVPRRYQTSKNCQELGR